MARDSTRRSLLTERLEDRRLLTGAPFVGPIPDAAALVTHSSQDAVGPSSARHLCPAASCRLSPAAGIDGSGTAVVVIDTGLDRDHPAFGPDNDGDGIADRIVFSYDFADNDDDVSDTTNGHGTHVTSLIGSELPDSPGVAPQVDLIHLKVFRSANGMGDFRYLNDALQWVIEHIDDYNIVAINLSIGDGMNHATAKSLYSVGDDLAVLHRLGVVTVASTGNRFATYGSQLGVEYPAADPHVMTVGAVFGTDGVEPVILPGGTVATPGHDRIAPFTQRHETLLDLLAPGVAIDGADLNGTTSQRTGTSQAAALVTGSVALAQQYAQQTLGRHLTPDELRDLLIDSATILHDGDDEDDNVINSQLDFPRLNLAALGDAIATLAGQVTFDSLPVGNYGGAEQNTVGTVTTSPTAIEMHGNRWQYMPLDYSITPATRLEFDFRSESMGELHTIGLDTDLVPSIGRTFNLYGSQAWGFEDFKTYDGDGEFQHFSIPVGDFFRGRMSYLFFGNDHDVSDPTAHSEFANVQIYEATPPTPRQVDDFFAIDEDSLDVELDVLANDTAAADPVPSDGPTPLTISAVESGINGGTVQLNENRLFYTPPPNFAGTDAFDYMVDDGTTIATATVRVLIRNVNDNPTAHDDSFSIPPNTFGSLLNVLTNDSSAPDPFETLFVTDVGPSEVGSVIGLEGATRIEYLPPTNFVGSDHFVYEVGDGTPGSIDTATVRVDVGLRETIVFDAEQIISQGGALQDIDVVTSLSADGKAITLSGNGWKALPWGYNVQPSTVIEFDFAVTQVGQLHAIGIDTDDHPSVATTFRLLGSEPFGNADFLLPEMPSGPVHLRIPIGTYYNGPINRIVLINDDDRTLSDGETAASATFSSIRIYDLADRQIAPEPIPVSDEVVAGRARRSRIGTNWV